MKSVIRIGLAVVFGLIATPVSAQQTPNWTYVTTSSSHNTFYIDTANMRRDGAYVQFYAKTIRLDGSYIVSNMVSNCDTHLNSILSVIFYTSSGEVETSSSYRSPMPPQDIMPGTVGWNILQATCSRSSARETISYPSYTLEPIGEGTLARNSDSYINVRERPSIDAPISRLGSPGEELVVWDSVFVDGYTWYKVAFRGSNATGWVREDLVWLY